MLQSTATFIRRRKEPKPRTRRILVPLAKNSRWSIRRGNAKKFEEFMKGKAFEIVETKISFFKAQPKTFTDCFVKQIYKSNLDFSFRRIAYIDGVHQQFNQHFQNELRQIENLDLNKEFEKFLASYTKGLLQSGKKKAGRTKGSLDETTGEIKGGLLQETKATLKLWNAGKDCEEIAKTLFPKCRYQEKKAKLRLIKRNLRDNPHLRTRKYNGK